MLHAVVPLLAVPWPVAQPRLAAFVVHTGDVSQRLGASGPGCRRSPAPP